jgi:serine/threonine protein kinase/tetratricopeptide (TPR) repeat protein
VTDAEALDWLDRLLSADEAARAASLDALAHSNPPLHARLRRMLTSALSPEHSQVLAAPVLDGFARLTDATRGVTSGDVLAGYRLIREIGRGGMSVVWLAERADGVVKRHVAFKMPMFILQGPADVDRFARERDALAALSHPNVARLYDAGVMESGQPFIVLEFVDGAPLTAFCDARRLDLRARVRLFLQVLAAVDHAHKHLIVHRDLKPSNILVDAESRVRLLDFGIAKLLGDAEQAAAMTQQAGGAMTPLYAAPEQIRGAAISTLTDVFALGAVLHELLTGVLPYKLARDRATVVDIHEALTHGELPRASQAAIDDPLAHVRGSDSALKLRTKLAGDLDTIVGKALRIAPEERYASAAHFADDLQRWLDLKPIAARRPSPWYSMRLALVRHRLAAGVAGAGLLLLAGAGGVAWTQHLASRAHEARTAAVRNFMFDLVNDAEPAEGQQGEVTGRQMVSGAVARARRDFATQPQLRGELLVELGRMFVRLGAGEDAAPVLAEGIDTLETSAPPDDPALNKGRVYLAGVLMETSDDLARVTTLARTARDACVGDAVDCVKARAYAGNLLSQLASFAGDEEQALVEMRRSASETEAAFGVTHAETVVALMSLAITARNAGQLREAGDAMSRAMEVASAVRMRAADRAQLERTMALIDYDLGRYIPARNRFRMLIASTPDAAERALQWRILANLHAELGEGEQALLAADEGLTVLPGDSIQERPFLRQARARALALTGRIDEAVAAIDAVIGEFGALGRAADSFEVLRARRYRAGFLLEGGKPDEALRELRALGEVHSRVALSSVERGLVLDLLGEAEHRFGNAAVARAAHAAAGAALGEQLPLDHPYRVRNAALSVAVSEATNRVVRQ